MSRYELYGCLLRRGTRGTSQCMIATCAIRCLPDTDAGLTEWVYVAGLPEVAVGGRDLSFWTFDANNVLAWADEAGYTAWLQFTVLPGGPVFMGTLHPSGQDAAASDAGESPPFPADSGNHPHHTGRVHALLCTLWPHTAYKTAAVVSQTSGNTLSHHP